MMMIILMTGGQVAVVTRVIIIENATAHLLSAAIVARIHPVRDQVDPEVLQVSESSPKKQISSRPSTRVKSCSPVTVTAITWTGRISTGETRCDILAF
jgi:hypothetical protein